MEGTWTERFGEKGTATEYLIESEDKNERMIKSNSPRKTETQFKTLGRKRKAEAKETITGHYLALT